MEILWVLGIPLAGAVLLAGFGQRKFAPELNASLSFATLIASGTLVARVVSAGPMRAFVARSWTTTKSQPWEFPGLDARVAAKITRSISSRGIASGFRYRIARVVSIASIASTARLLAGSAANG